MKRIFLVFFVCLMFAPIGVRAEESGTVANVEVATSAYVDKEVSLAKSKVRDGENGTTYLDMWVE